MSRIIAAVFSAFLMTSVVAAQQEAAARRLTRVPAPVGPDGRFEDLYTASYALLVGVNRYDDAAAWSALESVTSELADPEFDGGDLVFAVPRPRTPSVVPPTTIAPKPAAPTVAPDVAVTETANSARSFIRGTASDQSSGATLPGVDVMVESPSIATPLRVVTDQRGEYHHVGLRPGIYRITFTRNGTAVLRGYFELTSEGKRFDVKLDNPGGDKCLCIERWVDGVQIETAK
jgi:hypothetical protein